MERWIGADHGMERSQFSYPAIFMFGHMYMQVDMHVCTYMCKD